MSPRSSKQKRLGSAVDQQVAERTAELAKGNELRKEIGERRKKLGCMAIHLDD